MKLFLQVSEPTNGSQNVLVKSTRDATEASDVGLSSESSEWPTFGSYRIIDHLLSKTMIDD